MNDQKFLVLEGDPSTRFGEIEDMPGVQGGDWKIAKGMPLAADLPADAAWTIAPDSGNIIGDFVKNLKEALIVSQRARDFLESEGVKEPDVEYLPFVLKNKKGRVVEGTQYYLGNVLRKISCLDRTRGKFTVLNEERVSTLNVFFLLADKIPDDVKVFRLAEYSYHIMFRNDLIERIKAAGLTGFHARSAGVDEAD